MILITIISILVSLSLLMKDVDVHRDQLFFIRSFKVLFCIVISIFIPKLVISQYSQEIQTHGLVLKIFIYFGTIIFVLGLELIIYDKFREWNSNYS